MHLAGVQPEHINIVWVQIEPQIKKLCAEKFNDFTAEDIHMFLSKGDMQLWLALTDKNLIKGLAVTEVLCFPQTKVCRFVFTIGEAFDEWAHFKETIEDWAESMGARLEILATPGLARKLKKYGYKATHVMLEKEKQYG